MKKDFLISTEIHCLCFMNMAVPASPSIHCCCVTERHRTIPLGLNTHMSEYRIPEEE